MGFAAKGHARVDRNSPRAFANCDMCGFLYNHSDLKWEMQYRGKEIERTGFLVCETCWDEPNPQLQPFVLPADPVPLLNPRKEHPSLDIDQTVYTVATLPSAVTSGTRYYTFVSDSLVNAQFGTYGTVVFGTGTFTVPVVSDGTNWRIA